MKRILKIAKLELSVLFYSPIAWIVLAIFVVQCSISFFGYLNDVRITVSMGFQTIPITQQLFGGPSGLFTVIQGTLYLYIPILTMGLMSRETSSGSIKLLLSSPVKLREIILGKYLSIVTFCLTLIGILSLFGILGSFIIKDAETGTIISGLLGLYLLVCTYAAIGLFMSCLTTYPVVAAISTLAIFAVLRYVGSIGQNIDFIRDLTYFLSISGRTEKMVAGLITTKDLFYYGIIIASFLFLCVFRLKTEREINRWPVRLGRYAGLASIALLLGYLTSRPNLTGYIDTTSAKSLTITPKSQELAKQFTGPVTVTTYANLLAPNLNRLLPASRNGDLSKIEQYKRFIPGLESKYVYYFQPTVDTNYRIYKYSPNTKGITDINTIAEKTVTNMDIDGSLFLPPADINKLVNLEPEGYMPVRRVEYKGKSAFIRFYLDANPEAGEAEFMAALKRLLIKAPKVAFVTGNNERQTESKGDRDYRMLSALKTRRTALINQGFDIEKVDLNTQPIPADIDVLVIADPTVPLSAAEQQKISTYVENGGNMLITGEPGRQSVLNPLLQGLGVQLKHGILLNADKTQTPGFISARLSPKALGLDSNLDKLQKLDVPVAMQGAAAIEDTHLDIFNIRPLLLSGPGGWNKNIQVNTGIVPESTETKHLSKQETPLPAGKPTKSVPGLEESSTGAVATPVTVNTVTGGSSSKSQGAIDLTTVDQQFDPAQGDEQGIFPVSVSLSRKIGNKEQRIVVSGDADFISNAELSRIKRGENQYYMFGVFRWLSGGEFPIDASRPPAKDMDLKISRAQITTLTLLYKIVLPALIAILGAMLLFRRRRK